MIREGILEEVLLKQQPVASEQQGLAVIPLCLPGSKELQGDDESTVGSVHSPGPVLGPRGK